MPGKPEVLVPKFAYFFAAGFPVTVPVGFLAPPVTVPVGFLAPPVTPLVACDPPVTVPPVFFAAAAADSGTDLPDAVPVGFFAAPAAPPGGPLAAGARVVAAPVFAPVDLAFAAAAVFSRAAIAAFWLASDRVFFAGAVGGGVSFFWGAYFGIPVILAASLPLESPSGLPAEPTRGAGAPVASLT